MAQIIQVRRDYASTWTTVNPVLRLGEFGLERDTRKLKLGDGVTAWNDLGYTIVNATQISLVDADGHYTGDSVEDALAEIGAILAQSNADKIVSIPVNIPTFVGMDGRILAYNEELGEFYLKTDDGGGGGFTKVLLRDVVLFNKGMTLYTKTRVLPTFRNLQLLYTSTITV